MLEITMTTHMEAVEVVEDGVDIIIEEAMVDIKVEEVANINRKADILEN